MAAPAREVRARRGQSLGMPAARFLRDYWQKRPLLIRNAFSNFTPPLTPDDLAGLACMDGVLARIVEHGSPSRPRNGRDPVPRAAKTESDRQLRRTHNDGTWTVRTGPFQHATFAKLRESHWTLLVQDVDKWDPDTAALLDAFSFLPSWRIDDVMVSYATDGGGVGAHLDQYDVFLLQGSGRRHWSIDTRPDPATDFRDDAALRLLRTFAPTHEWSLTSGDMLYLPPGIPHAGVAVGECMTFSIGMRAPSTAELLLDFAAHVAESLPESQRFADPDLSPATTAGEIDASALGRARCALGDATAALSDDAFADWFGCFMTRYRNARDPEPRKRAISAATLPQKLASSVVVRDPWSRFAWRRRGRDAVLYASGQAFAAPPRWAATFSGRERKLEGAALLRLPRRAEGLRLLKALIDTGHLRLRAA